MAINGFGNKFNLTKQQLDLFNKKDVKLKSLRADFLVVRGLHFQLSNSISKKI